MLNIIGITIDVQDASQNIWEITSYLVIYTMLESNMGKIRHAGMD